MSQEIINIRAASQKDKAEVWEIIKEVISTGDTYVFDPNSSYEKMIDYWFADDKYTYVAEINGEIVGTFVLKANQIDLGSHIANGSYMTLPKAFGKGIGTEMGKFSLVEAKRLGFKAIQFNLVVKTNEIAVKLWQKIGFEIIGEIPEAFQHQKLGLVNAYIMYQAL